METTKLKTQLADLSAASQAAATAISLALSTAFLETETASAASAANIITAFADTAASIDGIFSTAAQTMNNGFVESTVIISEMFGTTFAGIKEIANNSALMISESIINCSALSILGFQEMQIAGEAAYVALQLSAANMARIFVDSLAVMSTESDLQFDNIKIKGQSVAEDIKNSFAEALRSIELNFGLTKDISGMILDQIQLTFSNSTTNIIQNFNSIESQANASGTNSKSSFDMFSNAVLGGIDGLSKINTIITTFNGLVTAMKTIQTATTAATIADTAAKGANIPVTAGAGATSAGAATGFLAAGAGALMLGGGVLACAMGIALLAKVAFNALKLFGLNTNGVKASDFNMSFSIPGLAEGGLPPVGQMFIAREAGPELVGTIGSRNAVVNNNQIVESVSAGVARAVENVLLKGSGNSSVPIAVTVNIGNEQLDEYIFKSGRRRALITNGGTY